MCRRGWEPNCRMRKMRMQRTAKMAVSQSLCPIYNHSVVHIFGIDPLQRIHAMVDRDGEKSTM